MPEDLHLPGKVRLWFAKHDPDHVHVVGLLIRFEGCRAKPYQDVEGTWTVGVGHVMTPDQADNPKAAWSVEAICAALQHDIAMARARIWDDVWKASSVKQRQAMLALSFNVGKSVTATTVLGHAIQDYLTDGGGGGMARVVREWVTYDHAGGAEVRGLLRRRLAECQLWVDGS